MLTIKYQNSFKKDFKLIKKRGYDICKLQNVLDYEIHEDELILHLLRTGTHSDLF